MWEYVTGENGELRRVKPIPDQLRLSAQTAREKMLDVLSLFSEPLTECLLAGEPIPTQLIVQTIRQATLNLELTPVLLGSAYKNKGVQTLLDAIADYLPSSVDREAIGGIEVKTGEAVNIAANPGDPLVALAFKLTVEPIGQLTYIRIYSGTLKPGDHVYHARTGERLRIGQLKRMHANKQEDIDIATAYRKAFSR